MRHFFRFRNEILKDWHTLAVGFPTINLLVCVEISSVQSF